MGGSDIYISVTKTHTWLLSLEPNKHFIPFLPRRSHPASHFAARWDRDAETWVVDDHSANGIVGAILVARGTHCSVQQAQSTIVEHLNVEDSNINAIPSEQTPHGKSDLDHWTRKALHVLQADSIIPSFDVGEFMTFAHAYAAKRQENQGAARCTYPMLDRRDDGSKKRFSTV